MTQGCFREVGISRKRLCPPETSGSTAAGQEAVEAVSWTPPLFGAHTFVPPLTTDFTGLALHTQPSKFFFISSEMFTVSWRSLIISLSFIRGRSPPLPLIFFLAHLLSVLKIQPRCPLQGVSFAPFYSRRPSAPLGFQPRCPLRAVSFTPILQQVPLCTHGFPAQVPPLGSLLHPRSTAGVPLQPWVSSSDAPSGESP